MSGSPRSTEDLERARFVDVLATVLHDELPRAPSPTETTTRPTPETNTNPNPNRLYLEKTPARPRDRSRHHPPGAGTYRGVAGRAMTPTMRRSVTRLVRSMAV